MIAATNGSIMVPLDGSVKDARALSVAGALADLAHADIHLVHVLGRTRGQDSDPPPEARREAEQRLTRISRNLAADTHHRVDYTIGEGTAVAEMLIQHAAERDALLVVMGTRAPSEAGLLLVGSVADQVMRACSKPVVLVPPGAEYMAGKRIQFRRVLVPLDGSALSEQTLHFLLRFPQAAELEYVLLEVVASSGDGEDADEDDVRVPRRVEDARVRLLAAVGQLHAHGLTTVELRVLEADDPADGIAAAVREFLVELIAMSTRGAGGLRRMALGSVAERVVRASEMPVLLLTPVSLATV